VTLLVQWEVARRRAAVGGTTMLTAAWWPWYEFTLHARTRTLVPAGTRRRRWAVDRATPSAIVGRRPQAVSTFRPPSLHRTRPQPARNPRQNRTGTPPRGARLATCPPCVTTALPEELTAQQWPRCGISSEQAAPPRRPRMASARSPTTTNRSSLNGNIADTRYDSGRHPPRARASSRRVPRNPGMEGIPTWP